MFPLPPNRLEGVQHMPQAPLDSSQMIDDSGISVIAEIVDSAIAEAKRLGNELPADPKEACTLH